MATATSPPTAPPAAAPAAAAPPPPLRGLVRDAGAVRRDSVRAARWIAAGTVKVTGDVTVTEAALRGLATIGGKFTADRCSVHGTLEVRGGVDVRTSATLEGTFRPLGPVHFGSAIARGVIRAVADLEVDRLFRVAGALEAPSLHTGALDLDGSATVPGEIVALAGVRAQFRADSQLGSISARSVSLQGPPPGLVPTILRKVFGGNATVSVERIEADHVELEAVTVEFVRSREVVLGPEAHVATVEGTIVRQHPSAHVGPESRTPPPPGLSR
jgi:hypothetical protein